MSDTLRFAESVIGGDIITLDMYWNVLDSAGRPKPYTCEQQAQLLRLFLKHSMISQSYNHHRQWADAIKDQEGLERKEKEYKDILSQIQGLVRTFDVGIEGCER